MPTCKCLIHQSPPTFPPSLIFGCHVPCLPTDAHRKDQWQSQERVSRYTTRLVDSEPGDLGFRYIKQTMFAFRWPSNGWTIPPMRLAQVATNCQISAEACKQGWWRDWAAEERTLRSGDVDWVQGEWGLAIFLCYDTTLPGRSKRRWLVRKPKHCLFRCGAHITTSPLSIGIPWRPRDAFNLVCCRHFATI